MAFSLPASAGEEPASATQSAPMPGPHRVSVAVGPGRAWCVGIDDDGHWDADCGRIGLRAAYDFAAIRFIDVGVGLEYWGFGLGKKAAVEHTFMPGVRIRGHGAIGDVDIGWIAEPSLLFMIKPNSADDVPPYDQPSRTRLWHGWALAGGPDFRYRAVDHLFVEVAPEAVIGWANDTSGAHGFYMRKSGGFVALGVWVGAVIAP